MTTELFIWVLATNLSTLALSSIFYATRVDEMRRESQRRLEEANGEIVASRQMIHKWAAQARVLNSVPVARLIDREETP